MAAAANVADLIVARRSLVPPVDIETLLAEKADVEVVDWPANADAVMVRRGRDRPLVFYSRNNVERPRRIRYTLAHELGHIEIGWQVGNLTCSPLAEGFAIEDNSSRLAEREADAFASAFLIPRKWLRVQVSAFGDDMSGLLGAVDVAEASTTATVLAVKEAVQAGWVFQINQRDWFYSSPGTDRSFTLQGSMTEARQQLDRVAFDHGRCDSTDNVIRWWRMFEGSKVPPTGDPGRETRDFLVVALAACGLETYEHTVNGKVGYAAKDQRGNPADQVYQILHYRFQAVPRYELLAEHPDFQTWLARRAIAISERS